MSWLRLQVKVQNDAHKYYWYKINVLVDWQSSGVTKIILFDPKPYLSERIAAKLVFSVPEDRSHLKDPFWVYGQVLEDLIAMQDTSVWQIRDLTRSAEKRNETVRGSQASVTYFDTLHNILRHAIHSTETLQTTVKTIRNLMSSHETLGTRFAQAHTELAGEQQRYLEEARSARAAGTSNFDMEKLVAHVAAAESALTKETSAEKLRRHVYHHNDERFRYYEHFFESTLERSMANKERLTNQIQLEFNKVTKADSEAMKTVAFVTLLFLPATFVAAIFSTTFFALEDGEWTMSSDFWKYWAFALPITFSTALLWTLLFHKSDAIWWCDQILTWLSGGHEGERK